MRVLDREDRVVIRSLGFEKSLVNFKQLIDRDRVGFERGFSGLDGSFRRVQTIGMQPQVGLDAVQAAKGVAERKANLFLLLSQHRTLAIESQSGVSSGRVGLPVPDRQLVTAADSLRLAGFRLDPSVRCR